MSILASRVRATYRVYLIAPLQYIWDIIKWVFGIFMNSTFLVIMLSVVASLFVPMLNAAVLSILAGLGASIVGLLATLAYPTGSFLLLLMTRYMTIELIEIKYKLQ